MNLPFDLIRLMDFPGGSDTKHLPTMRETRVRSLGGEDPLEKDMAAYPSALVWRIPWTEEPGTGSQSWTQLSDVNVYI